MSASHSRASGHHADEALLHRLGYAQVLYREMGGFSNFAISFTIISVLTGAVLLFGYGLKLAGPVINTVQWIVRKTLGLFGVKLSMELDVLAAHEEIRGAVEYHHSEGLVETGDRYMLGGVLDLGEMDVSEVARCLGIPETTVRSRFFRARSMLRELLADYAAERGIRGAADTPAGNGAASNTQEKRK